MNELHNNTIRFENSDQPYYLTVREVFLKSLERALSFRDIPGIGFEVNPDYRRVLKDDSIGQVEAFQIRMNIRTIMPDPRQLDNLINRFRVITSNDKFATYLRDQIVLLYETIERLQSLYTIISNLPADSNINAQELGTLLLQNGIPRTEAMNIIRNLQKLLITSNFSTSDLKNLLDHKGYIPLNLVFKRIPDPSKAIAEIYNYSLFADYNINTFCAFKIPIIEEGESSAVVTMYENFKAIGEEPDLFKADKGIFLELMKALAELHSKRLLHFDLHPFNVGYQKTNDKPIIIFDLTRARKYRTIEEEPEHWESEIQKQKIIPPNFEEPLISELMYFTNKFYRLLAFHKNRITQEDKMYVLDSIQIYINSIAQEINRDPAFIMDVRHTFAQMTVLLRN